MLIKNRFTSNIKQENQTTVYLAGRDLLGNLHKIEMLKGKKHQQYLVLADATVFKLYGQKLLQSLSKLNSDIRLSVIKGGEEQKRISNIPAQVMPFFQNNISRQSALLAFGGGVILDIGGFISSILFRGIDLVNIPSTLLSQIDAAIGGKNGVDLKTSSKTFIKNMLGTFKQPKLVITDISLLQSLPEREIINGLGEMLKYHLGWNVPAMTDLNKIRSFKKIDSADLLRIIVDCQKLKAEIIESDPYDKLKIREKLNLGHTIAHALEGVSAGKINHGEAVALGLYLETKISASLGIASLATLHQVKDLVNSLNIRIKMNKSLINKILKLLHFDKKGECFVLLKEIGEIKTGIEVSKKTIIQAFIGGLL